MSYVKKLSALADKFEKKIALAQTTGAQSGDVEDTLKSAGLWVSSNDIAPLLNTAKVPQECAVKISLVVDKALNVHFKVDATPPSPAAATLGKLLDRSYSAKMSAALKAAQLTVADTITAGLANFA